jgi:hypothetical protein
MNFGDLQWHVFGIFDEKGMLMDQYFASRLPTLSRYISKKSLPPLTS